MSEYHIKLPYPLENLDKFSLGDVLYLTGTVITARDQAHARIIEEMSEKRPLPFNPSIVRGNAIFHCGPLVQLNDAKTTYRVISAGPTTSDRMDPLTEKVARYLHPSFIIGKGGMSTYRPQRGLPLYLAFPGGCGALAAENIKAVKSVHWLDLGMPEALWVLDVEEFGPLLVAMDVHGKTLYD